MIDKEFLEKIIEVARIALEQEDRYIAGCMINNPNVFTKKDSYRGILELNNEGYYQFIITKSLMSSFDYYIKNELTCDVGRIDMTFFENNEMDNEPMAYCEIKRWMSSNGKKEIPGIETDIKKIKQTGKPGIMMIISTNPTEDTKSNIEWLEKEIPELVKYEKSYKCFNTIGWKGEANEFIVLGYLIC